MSYEEFAARYPNKTNPATGMLWTVEEAAADYGISVAQSLEWYQRPWYYNSAGAIWNGEPEYYVQIAGQWYRGTPGGSRVPIDLPPFLNIQPVVTYGAPSAPVNPAPRIILPDAPVSVATSTSSPGSSTSRPVNPAPTVPDTTVYYNKKGQPYAGEPDSYWLGKDASGNPLWYHGRLDGTVTGYASLPPWILEPEVPEVPAPIPPQTPAPGPTGGQPVEPTYYNAKGEIYTNEADSYWQGTTGIWYHGTIDGEIEEIPRPPFSTGIGLGTIVLGIGAVLLLFGKGLFR